MPNPIDHNAASPTLDMLMADYGAPPDDNGFSKHVLKMAARRARMRRLLILSAMFIAGLIAASRIKAAAKFVQNSDGLPASKLNGALDNLTALLTMAPPAPGTLSLSAMTTLYAGAALFSMIAIWLAKDVLDSQI